MGPILVTGDRLCHDEIIRRKVFRPAGEVECFAGKSEEGWRALYRVSHPLH